MSGATPSPLAVVQLLMAKYHAQTVAPMAAQAEAAAKDFNRFVALALDDFGELRARIAQLEEEVRQLRTVSERGHRGTYQPGALYERGEEVSLGGSTWRALVDDPQEQPPHPECWRLIAQGRRPGRLKRV